ncbi:MAG: biotin/lipoyl-containing protein, partial [Bacteroidota bacterium]|nr:biotin/lipoyl-containing protein [Bacteroidota bacterium]
MGKYFLKLPKMGESVMEATLTKWLKDVGESVEMDDIVVEIATDKVDSDVPSEVKGILIEKKFIENDVVQVGEVMAVIQTDGDQIDDQASDEVNKSSKEEEKIEVPPPQAKTLSLPDPLPEFETISKSVENARTMVSSESQNISSEFLSPLVKSIVKAEGLDQEELKLIRGSGKNNRITKKDILTYLSQRRNSFTSAEDKYLTLSSRSSPLISSTKTTTGSDTILKGDGDQIIEMTRMAKLTADHMIRSKQTSAHVQSFIEADMTNLWDWREKVKNEF